MKLSPESLRDRIRILEAQAERIRQDWTIEPDTRRADLRSIRRQLQAARQKLQAFDDGLS